MPTLQDIRQQYPQYHDMSDQALGDALHSKFYSDMPRAQFDAKIGLARGSEAGPTQPQAAAPGGMTPQPNSIAPGPQERGSGVAAAENIPEGPTWEAAQQKLIQLQQAGKGPGDPEFDQASREKAQGLARLSTGGLALAGGRIAKPLATGVAALGKAAGKGVAQATGTVVGSGATKAAEALRKAGFSDTLKAATAKEAQAAPLEARATQLGQTQQAIQAQPQVAAQRAAGRVAVEPGKQPISPAPSLDVVRQRTLAATRDAARAAEAEHRQAGATAQQARNLVMEQDAKIQAAEQGVANLEKELMAKPGATAEQFGTQLRSTAKSIADQFGRVRAQESGFSQALESAGDELRVPTVGVRNIIDQELRGTRNPALQSSLESLRMELTSDQKEALTVRSADSLRKYLDSILQNKTMFVQNQSRAVDKETLAVVSRIKKALVEATTNAWPAYRTALSKWRTLSRPLDIVERKGALRKALDTDPISTEYANTEAQVVGQVIQRARQGSPVFTRLLQQNPAVKDSARLYFTQDLFGKGAAPSPASLRTWLKTNEGPLKQLGLYDEFRDTRLAREAAQRAVDEAKGVKVQTGQQARAAEAAEQAAKKRAAIADRMRELAKERAGATKITVKPVAKSRELSSSAAQGSARLGREAASATGQAEKSRAIAERYRDFGQNVQKARPAEVPGEVRSFVDYMRRQGGITDAQRAEYLSQIQAVEDKFKATSEARRRLLKIAGAAALAGGVAEGYHVSKGLAGF